MNRKTIRKADRERAYRKYDGHCAYCGKAIAYKDMQVDHFVPLEGYSQKGTNDLDNLMPSCRRCNHYKRANSLEGWRRMLESIPKRLERDSYIYRVALDYGLIEPRPHKVQFYFEKEREQE